MGTCKAGFMALLRAAGSTQGLPESWAAKPAVTAPVPAQSSSSSARSLYPPLDCLDTFCTSPSHLPGHHPPSRPVTPVRIDSACCCMRRLECVITPLDMSSEALQLDNITARELPSIYREASSSKVSTLALPATTRPHTLHTPAHCLQPFYSNTPMPL